MQAQKLKEHTKGVIEGEVFSKLDYVDIIDGPPKPDVFVHSLYLVAPALKGYRYELLAIDHDYNTVYPCTVRSDTISRTEEHVMPFGGIENVEVHFKDATDQSELIFILSECFRSPIVRTVLDSMIAQVNDANQGIQYPKKR